MLLAAQCWTATRACINARSPVRPCGAAGRAFFSPASLCELTHTITVSPALLGMTASPSPPSTGGTAGPGAGKGAPAADAASTAPAGAFAKRFPRLSASFQKYSSTRMGRVTSTAWTRRRPILVGLAITYGLVNYAVVRRDAYLRDYIHPDSWLVLKVYPGSIVECKSTPNLVALLSSPSAGEDRAVTLELFEVCRALKWAMRDERIRGIFADFSGLHVPSSVAPEPLGMAQLEELVESIVSLLEDAYWHTTLVS